MLGAAYTTNNIQEQGYSWTEIESTFKYKLYAKDNEFDRFVEWVEDISNVDDVTNNNKANAADYSGYVISIHCELTNTGDACCLRHASKGGWCLQNKDSTTATNTIVMTHAEMETFVTSGYELTSAMITADNSTNDPQFELFDCDGSVAQQYSCAKFQVAYKKDGDYADGYPRFDTETSGAKSILYDHTQTGTSGAVNVGSDISFTSAVSLAAAGAAAIAMLAFN